MNEISKSIFQQLIDGRRTVHDFGDDIVPPDQIMSAIASARWAPNHHRTEPWTFYLLGENRKQQICEYNRELVAAAKGDKAADVKYRRWMAMPGWLVMTCTKSDDALLEREDYAACCCAAQNFSLVLWEQNIGVKWTTGAITRQAHFFDIIGADPDLEFVVGLFWYGYPKVIPNQHRRAVEEIVRVLD